MGYSGGRSGRVDDEETHAGTALPGGGRRGEAPFSFEHAAAELHASNRRRADLFTHPVMADKVMDIMLTALIAHEQQTVLTRMATAMANRLGLSDADHIIDELISARLLEGRTGDRIGLTPLGADLMRDYVNRARETAILLK